MMDTPGQRLGKYTLIKKLAIGGMAEIWLAEQTGPAGFHKQCVIKRILPQLATDQKFVEMFLDEARLAAQLEHPNIVHISDLGHQDGSYFIAMEYIDGADIDYMIERCEQLGVTMPLPIVARIISDALNGLDYAHNYTDRDGKPVGLVHRDISPHNILLNRAGVAKIVDFGVAKAATSSSKTQTGAVKGKFAYMSPEQISNQILDGRSDVFAMGIVLYEMATNARPFGDEGDLLAVTAILTQEPVSPRTLNAAFPAELEHIIKKALAKNREDRYASARDMSQALERFIASSGQFVTTSDVGAYLRDLLSPSPSFLQGQAAPPLAPRFDGEDGQGTDITPPPSNITSQQRPVEPSPPPFPSPAPTPKPPAPAPPAEGGGKAGLFIGIAAVLLLLGVGGGVGAFFLFGGEEGGRSGQVDTGTNGAQTTPDPKPAETNGGEEPADPPEAEETGSVSIKTTPSVTVLLDGKKRGETPLTLKLPPGKHKLTLRERKLYFRREVEVEVKKDATAKVNETLELGEAKLNVQPEDESKVWINGEEFKGNLSRPISLVAGENVVKVKNNLVNKEIEKKLKVEKGAVVVGEFNFLQ